MNLPANIIIPTSQKRRVTPALVALGALVLASAGVAAGLALGKLGTHGAPVTAAETVAPALPGTAQAPAATAAGRSAAAQAPARAQAPTPGPERSAAATPLATQPASLCRTCGTVEGVRAVQREGEGSGLGAVAGGVVGAVVGNQMGGGNGKKAMTVIGAIGGGVAGHEIEKRSKASTVYQVRVRMDDGSLRSFTSATAPTPGAEVRVEGDSYRVVQRQADDTPRTVQTKG